nr:hypothetical protein [Sphingomonas psychrotolerans]
MSRHLFWLSDKAWAEIEPHLPHGRPGKPRVDDRRVISGYPLHRIAPKAIPQQTHLSTQERH